MFEITPLARAKLLELAALPEHAGKDPRVFIDSKVCDGFRLEIAFDAPITGDACWSDGDLLLLVYERTAELIEGSRIDWDPAEERFVIDNPRAKAYRGKFFRKEDWRSRLAGLPDEADAEPVAG